MQGRSNGLGAESPRTCVEFHIAYCGSCSATKCLVDRGNQGLSQLGSLQAGTIRRRWRQAEQPGNACGMPARQRRDQRGVNESEQARQTSAEIEADAQGPYHGAPQVWLMRRTQTANDAR